MAVGEATARLFDELAGRGHEPLIANAVGSLRVELADGGRTDAWLVTMDRGRLSVSRGGGDADCVMRADAALFDALASGEANPMATLLRGAMTYEGDPELLLWFQRLLPGPPRRA